MTKPISFKIRLRNIGRWLYLFWFMYKHPSVMVTTHRSTYGLISFSYSAKIKNKNDKT